MKVGTHEKSYRTFVGNAIYVSVPGLIDPRVISRETAFYIYVSNSNIIIHYYFHIASIEYFKIFIYSGAYVNSQISRISNE